MANPLSQLENLAEQLVEGTFARILGARLQPIEVARYIARAMEDGQVIGAQGEVVVPNGYTVYLNPDDLRALESYQEALQEELQRYVIHLARAVGATMGGLTDATSASKNNTPASPVRSIGSAAIALLPGPGVVIRLCHLSLSSVKGTSWPDLRSSA